MLPALTLVLSLVTNKKREMNKADDFKPISTFLTDEKRLDYYLYTPTPHSRCFGKILGTVFTWFDADGKEAGTLDFSFPRNPKCTVNILPTTITTKKTKLPSAD